MANRAEEDLENYLLTSGIVSRKQLDLARKVQRMKQGPLLILLWQLSFITLFQLGNLMDWSS